MTTLNEITKKYDADTFNNYRTADLVATWEEITEEEKTGLRQRLEDLEKRNSGGEDLDVKADGFTDEEYEEFNDQDLFNELLILRNIID
jgi:hypothetical protein